MSENQDLDFEKKKQDLTFSMNWAVNLISKLEQIEQEDLKNPLVEENI